MKKNRKQKKLDGIQDLLSIYFPQKIREIVIKHERFIKFFVQIKQKNQQKKKYNSISEQLQIKFRDFSKNLDKMNLNSI